MAYSCRVFGKGKYRYGASRHCDLVTHVYWFAFYQDFDFFESDNQPPRAIKADRCSSAQYLSLPPNRPSSEPHEENPMHIRKKILSAMLMILSASGASALNVTGGSVFTSEYPGEVQNPVHFGDGQAFGGAEDDKSALKSNSLMPVPVTYQDFSGANLNLYAWEGRYTVLLSSRSDLSRSAMASILRTTDKIYLFYQHSTGYTPSLAKEFHGKATIADVAATCGAGCGYLGATGIELQSFYFEKLYNGVLANKTYDQPIFYEFGRNFWNLSSQLAYVSPDSPDAVITGFAVFMRFMAIEATGVRVGNFNDWTLAEFRSRVKAMVDLYVADPTQTWDNTLRLNRPQANNPSNLGGTDLFASFVFRLARDYGGDAFVNRLWKEAAKRPPATSTQDAVDNFFLAASAAANRNLTTLFTVKWRWPVSAAAQTAAACYPM
jgi:hypothetical protein